MNRREAGELAKVLAVRCDCDDVRVSGYPGGAEVEIEGANGAVRFKVGDDPESSPLLRYLVWGYVISAVFVSTC